jgi:hypothetical protein
MARQSRTINPKAARALSHLERMSNVARNSGRIARAAASIALAKEYRWHVPADAVGLQDERFLVKQELQAMALETALAQGLVCAKQTVGTLRRMPEPGGIARRHWSKRRRDRIDRLRNCLER